MGLLQTIKKRIFTGEKIYYTYYYGIIQEFLSAIYLTGKRAKANTDIHIWRSQL